MEIRGRNKISPEFSMSSMTDIVFLLLVFFMLTSTLVTTNALDLILPKAQGKTERKQNVSVSITKGLKYYIDKEQVNVTRIEARLRRILAKETDPTIVLRVEQGVPIEKAVRVMDIANRNRFKVILAVRPK